MADRHEIYAALTPAQRAQLQQRILRKSAPDGRGCRIHHFAAGGRRRVYAQVRLNEDTKLYAHKVMAMLHMGRPPVGDEEGSHLCGVPKCVKLEHLVLEPGDVNKTRDCCRMFLGVHHGYICPHEPPCIRPADVAAAAPADIVVVDDDDDDDDFE